jgi:membrane protein YdbS with pleckstrin-like domain
MRMPCEIDKVLNKDEKIVWDGKPRFASFVMGAFILTPFGANYLGFAVLGGLVGILVVLSGLIVFSWQYFFIGILITIGCCAFICATYRRTCYVISNRRLIIQTGLIKKDFKTVSHNQISNIKINVGVWDRIFNSGSIFIYAPRGAWVSKYGKNDTAVFPLSFYHISKPYEAFKILKKLVHSD